MPLFLCSLYTFLSGHKFYYHQQVERASQCLSCCVVFTPYLSGQLSSCILIPICEHPACTMFSKRSENSNIREVVSRPLAESSHMVSFTTVFTSGKSSLCTHTHTAHAHNTGAHTHTGHTHIRTHTHTDTHTDTHTHTHTQTYTYTLAYTYTHTTVEFPYCSQCRIDVGLM